MNPKISAFNNYSKYYDLIYQDKNYEKECDFIEEIFHRFSVNPVNTILEGGCGTGGHAIILAERGYKITGIDSSEMMIEHTKKKAEQNKLNLDFQVGDLREFDLHKKFNACICMFAVMGYITETEDLIKTLKNVRRHLTKGSLLIFDFWYGTSVLHTRPEGRIKIIQDRELRIIRTAEPELDSFNQLCRVSYNLIVLRGKSIIDEVFETHVVRYFFSQEITHYLVDTGFEVVRFCPFLNLDAKVDENVWNLTVIAKAF